MSVVQVVTDSDGKVIHYVDKPTTFVSTNISCGVYLMKSEVIRHLDLPLNGDGIWLETDVLPQMAGIGKLYALHTTRWWSQTKTAA